MIEPIQGKMFKLGDWEEEEFTTDQSKINECISLLNNLEKAIQYLAATAPNSHVIREEVNKILSNKE